MEQRFYVLIMPCDFRVSTFNWGPPVYIAPDFWVGLKDRAVHIKGSRGRLFSANEADKNAKVSGGHTRNLFFTKESHPLVRRRCLLASDLLATSAHGFCPALQVFSYLLSSSLALRHNSVLCVLLACLLRSVTIGSLRPSRFSLVLRHNRPLRVLLASLLRSVTIVLSLSLSLLLALCHNRVGKALQRRTGFWRGNFGLRISALGGAILVYGFQLLEGQFWFTDFRYNHVLCITEKAVSGV